MFKKLSLVLVASVFLMPSFAHAQSNGATTGDETASSNTQNTTGTSNTEQTTQTTTSTTGANTTATATATTTTASTPAAMHAALIASRSGGYGLATKVAVGSLFVGGMAAVVLDAATDNSKIGDLPTATTTSTASSSN